MTEVDYEHECMRAELLGLAKPEREEFLSRQREIKSEKKEEGEGGGGGRGKEEEEERKEMEAEEEGIRREGFQRIGGGLEELNSLLSSTQKKLNRFKTVCGSFSNLLKLQIGAKKETTEKDYDDRNSCSAEVQESEEVSQTAGTASSAAQMKNEGNSQLEKLDSLIKKAERAEMSLSTQNKQIKKFLN